MRVSGLIVAALLASSVSAVAQEACGPQRAGSPSAPDVPALMGRYPNGGGALSTEIRNLASGDPSSVAAIMASAGSGSSAQQLALGTGLGAAATLCLRSQPQTARMIQRAVADGANPEVSRGFEGVTGDILTAATGANAGASTTAAVADTGGSGVGGAPRPRPTESAGGAVVPSNTLLSPGGGAFGTIAQRASVFRP